MAVIPQEATLFKGTVRENVDPLGQYTDGSIWTALHRCHLAGVVRDLDASQNLSAGQAQLLCLVRAVLHNAKILCVDEATANVDEETDKLIQQTLRSNFRQSTVIIIAHRVRTILDCDRVLVMGSGTVLEFDSPDKLLQDRHSHFYQLLHQDYDS
ncbi:Multidrug resistance-associated protein 7 [Homalodisca vitripennis]|nr:Multidrug resistance-associated protein 7 [Homalodisca vitripennis]